jgi:DNA-binding response OmpR family regulator
MRLLLVEDDPHLGKATLDGLGTVFAVDWAHNVADGLIASLTIDYDMIILDLTLPDGSGFEILKSVKQRKNAPPVLLLTAKALISQRVEGLNSGADDYLVKPFDLDELIARCRALMRRMLKPAELIHDCGDIVYEPTARKVFLAGKDVALSARELAILDCLMSRRGNIVSKAEIENSIYDWQTDIESNTVEVHISGIRRKLRPDIIKTVRGIGYTILDER